jgi:hypothetical protein
MVLGTLEALQRGLSVRQVISHVASSYASAYARVPLKRLVLVIALVGFLLIATPAQSWTPPGDRPAGGGLVSTFALMADGFWRDRGFSPCPPERLNLRLASDLSDGLPWHFAYGRGELGGCRVWVLSRLVKQAAERPAGNDRAVYLCRTITMEIGHTAGLDDDMGGGVMGRSR